MDIVYIGAIAFFFGLTWAMAAGCAQLGARQ
jgi:hypothetical protein